MKKRLHTVLGTIYLLFNEGYSASKGNDIVRYEICEEAKELNESKPYDDISKGIKLLTKLLAQAPIGQTVMDKPHTDSRSKLIFISIYTDQLFFLTSLVNAAKK